jgi:hypothetical protein
LINRCDTDYTAAADLLLPVGCYPVKYDIDGLPYGQEHVRTLTKYGRVCIRYKKTLKPGECLKLEVFYKNRR